MVWSCENGTGGRSVEISGKNGSIGGKSRKTKENLERYSKERFGTNMSGRACGIRSRKLEKDRRSNP